MWILAIIFMSTHNIDIALALITKHQLVLLIRTTRTSSLPTTTTTTTLASTSGLTLASFGREDPSPNLQTSTLDAALM
jgi:hypothetical protein